MGKSKRNMGRRLGMLFLSVVLLGLGGCTKAEATMSDKLLLSETLNESEEISVGMQQFESYKAAGNMTEDGELVKTVRQTEAAAPTPVPAGLVHVTFAENNLLGVNYYTDAELQNKLSTGNCWLEPNTCIYASAPVEKNEYSNMYKFECFQIYSYDSEGKRILETTVDLKEGNLLFQIPVEAEQTEFSVVPLGSYTDRIVTMSDYVVNLSGETEELYGKWMINSKESYENSAAISPLSSYVVSYEYNSNLYYFVSASPEKECHYPRETGNMSGEVIFKNQEPGNAVEDYSVELHKYLSATIDNKAKGLLYVKVIGRDEEYENEKQIEISKLKCGSVLEIKTDKVHKLHCTNMELAKPSEDSDGYVYQIVLPDIAETKLNLLVQKWDKKTIDITVDKSASRKFWEKAFVNGDILTLCCGSDKVYTYEDLLDGKKVELNEYENLEIVVSTKLPKNCRVRVTINNEEEFLVNADSTLFKKILDYNDVSSLQIVIQNTENEDVEKQTKLKVVLDKSLNNNVLFSIEASGKNVALAKGYIKGQETIYDKNVDSEQDIVISAKGTQLISGTAIKLIIEKDGKVEEIRYTTGKDLREVIAAQMSDGTYCGEMEILISVVNIITHNGSSVENGTVNLKFADVDGKVIKDGDILEDSRKVVVTITAKDGYYISYSTMNLLYKENDTVYKRTMSYSDYVEKISKILADNPIKKLVKVTLSDVTPYQVGTVTFKIDGKSKSTGTYFLKEGQKVEIIYTVPEDSEYGIVSDGFTSIVGNWISKFKFVDEKTATVTVSQEMDGTVISVENSMEVQIEKKEN